ncbi:hypothetical protein WJX74_002398 [Apatococcus lobatus]|uniref:Uncharacterized protein n=1 Tax=Apatococcus lobatus TaxID=904363 RepID=A0AAW1QCL7_9CHLO
MSARKQIMGFWHTHSPDMRELTDPVSRFAKRNAQLGQKLQALYVDDPPKNGAWYREVMPTLRVEDVKDDPAHLMRRISQTLDPANKLNGDAQFF